MNCPSVKVDARIWLGAERKVESLILAPHCCRPGTRNVDSAQRLERVSRAQKGVARMSAGTLLPRLSLKKGLETLFKP